MKTQYLFYILILFTFFSCNKENPEPVIIDQSTENFEINFLFSQNRENAIQEFSVNTTDGTNTITGQNGTILTFSENTFSDIDGNLYSGNVKIEMIETQDKRDMLWMDRSTVADNGELLVSGGIVYVNVTTPGGSQLSINDNKPITARIPTTSLDPMDFFRGSEDQDGRFSWTEDQTMSVTTNTVTDPDSLQNDTTNWGNWEPSFYYDFQIDSIGWINCDYFWGWPDLTPINVQITDTANTPDTLYNHTNTSVFIYYHTINSIERIYSSTPGIFSTSQSPIGMDVSFIIVSELASGSYYYAIVPIPPNVTQISNNHIENVPSSDMIGPVTTQDIQAVIAQLP